MGKTVSLMLDTKGPEMRLGDFAEGKVYLKKGNKFTLTNDDIPGDETHVSINHKNFTQKLNQVILYYFLMVL